MIVWLVFRVAIGAGRKAGVLKVSRFPRLRCVTHAAFARIVADRRIDLVASLAISRILVIKTRRLKGYIGMATLARQAHFLKLAFVLVLVATHASRGQAFGLPADVTLIAIDLRMFARKSGAMLGGQVRRQRD